jgi:hypothetical protein
VINPAASNPSRYPENSRSSVPAPNCASRSFFV